MKNEITIQRLIHFCISLDVSRLTLPVRSLTRFFLQHHEAGNQPGESFRVVERDPFKVALQPAFARRDPYLTNALRPTDLNRNGNQGSFQFGRHFVGRALLSAADALAGPAQRKSIAFLPDGLTRSCPSYAVLMTRRSLRFGLP